MIELKEDHPDAVFQLLRYIYTQEDRIEKDDDWRLQLEISKVAQKYLCPRLRNAALRKFRDQVIKIVDPTEVYRAIFHIRSVSDDEDVLKWATALHDRYLLALLKHLDYRECLEQDMAAMWKALDELETSKPESLRRS